MSHVYNVRETVPCISLTSPTGVKVHIWRIHLWDYILVSHADKLYTWQHELTIYRHQDSLGLPNSDLVQTMDNDANLAMELIYVGYMFIRLVYKKWSCRNIMSKT